MTEELYMCAVCDGWGVICNKCEKDKGQCRCEQPEQVVCSECDGVGELEEQP